MAYFRQRRLYATMNTNNIKLKLAALAKDEGAYLPEWIFHHLTFGVDEIEVYVNNTTDNSVAVLTSIAQHYPVKITFADKLFKSATFDFQVLAYNKIVKAAVADGFTHLLLLDIDEFWTPADFSTSIKQAIINLGEPDVVNFNWFVHCDESEFGPCYQPSMKIRTNPHVKTLFKLAAPWDKVGIHNVLGKSLTYTRGDGKAFDFGDSPHCALSDAQCLDHDYFIVHRLYRSEREYISLLGRGRLNKTKIKDNRAGYYIPSHQDKTITFPAKLIDLHYQGYAQFLKECGLLDLLADSKVFVLKRFQHVISLAIDAKKDDIALYVKLFNHIKIPEVIDVKNFLGRKVRMKNFNVQTITQQSWSALLLTMLAKALIKIKCKRIAHRCAFLAACQLAEDSVTPLLNSVRYSLVVNKYPEKKHADIYRDMAVEFHREGQLSLACGFITKAKQCRPNGPRIIQLYEQFMHERNVMKSSKINGYVDKYVTIKNKVLGNND